MLAISVSNLFGTHFVHASGDSHTGKRDNPAVLAGLVVGIVTHDKAPLARRRIPPYPKRLCERASRSE